MPLVPPASFADAVGAKLPSKVAPVRLKDTMHPVLDAVQFAGFVVPVASMLMKRY